jgi:hypothetical protein
MSNTQLLEPQQYTEWNDRLAFDIALRLEGSGEELPEICLRHNIITRDILRFNKDPVFRSKVQALRDDIKANGVTFKMKARAQAEELLTTSWLMIHNPDVSPAVRADLIKSTVKWAGLEPKPNEVDTNTGGGVKITINLGGGPATAVATKTIEGTTNPQEGEAA